MRLSSIWNQNNNKCVLVLVRHGSHKSILRISVFVYVWPVLNCGPAQIDYHSMYVCMYSPAYTHFNSKQTNTCDLIYANGVAVRCIHTNWWRRGTTFCSRFACCCLYLLHSFWPSDVRKIYVYVQLSSSCMKYIILYYCWALRTLCGCVRAPLIHCTYYPNCPYKTLD